MFICTADHKDGAQSSVVPTSLEATPTGRFGWALHDRLGRWRRKGAKESEAMTYSRPTRHGGSTRARMGPPGSSAAADLMERLCPRPAA